MFRGTTSKVLKITGYLSGNCNDHERREIESWIQKSESNRKFFAQMKFAWESSQTKPMLPDADIQAALNKVNNNIAKAQTYAHVRKPVPRAFHKKGGMILRVAAGLILLVGLFWIIHQRYDTAREIITVEAHTPKEFSTPDGSEIILNHRSVLQYPSIFDNNHRSVILKGEAFFNIAHQPERPFIITAGHLIVTVKGTSFFVRAYEHSPTVVITVETGSVVVGHVNRETGEIHEQIMLHKNEKATFGKETGLIAKSAITDQNHKGWISHKLEFDNTPITQVVQLLESVYGLSFSIEIPTDHLLLTARFDNEDPDNILKALSLIFGFNTARSGNEVRIY